MKIAFAINEAYPLYKIGGLGDVGASLPRALVDLGVDTRILLPKHPEIRLPDSYYVQDRFPLIYDRQRLSITVYTGFLPRSRVPAYLFAEDRYLSQHTDASDNHADKYTVFSLCISHWLSRRRFSWVPHLVHLNDWHTSLIPLFLTHKYKDRRFKFLITIHNLAYQGITQTRIIQKSALDPSSCQILLWDQLDNDINILMEGLLHSHTITTVSPTYAQEILTHRYGEKLHHILKAKQARLFGILNGLDTVSFDPAADPALPVKYTPKTAIKAKTANKLHLFDQFGLDPNPGHLLIGFVGRVDPRQKGIDLILHAIKDHSFPGPGKVFFFLGTGDPQFETLLHQAAGSAPNIRIVTRYDDPLSRLIYAASDLLLIPSLYEPCGLIQLIAMRYGSLPVARATGGLKDTITHNHNGFLFPYYSTRSMLQALSHAQHTIGNNQRHQNMIQSAMQHPMGWENSAKLYLALYQKTLLT